MAATRMNTLEFDAMIEPEDKIGDEGMLAQARALSKAQARIATLEADVARLREALNERESDMHIRIRQDYDKTVADCWRAEVARLREALAFYADQGSWTKRDARPAQTAIELDYGQRAQAALAKPEPPKGTT